MYGNSDKRKKGKEREEHIEEGNEMKVRKYGHEPAQTSSQAKRIGNRPTLFLELFGRTDRRKPINRLQYRHHFSRSRLVFE